MHLEENKRTDPPFKALYVDFFDFILIKIIIAYYIYRMLRISRTNTKKEKNFAITNNNKCYFERRP